MKQLLSFIILTVILTASAAEDDLKAYGLWLNGSPRAAAAAPVETRLPLQPTANARIAFVGNGMFDRMRNYGYFESLLQQQFPDRQLSFRNLAWPGDEPGLQPRPDNFADTDQYLTHEKADIIFAAFGFNESFSGDAGSAAFRQALTKWVQHTRATAYNGKNGPQVILVSPAANENMPGNPAGDRNNSNLAKYTQVIKEVAAAEKVGFVDVFTGTGKAIAAAATPITVNGASLNDAGYALLGRLLFQGAVGEAVPALNEALRQAVIDKNSQYFQRVQPLNTFYYVGGRSKGYGYLDFLPAMRSFEMMTANRDRRIWDLAAGKPVTGPVDDSNLPPLEEVTQGKGANKWLSPADELASFDVDPGFTVSLFASEEQFPDIACPIQMRWDAVGRLWVSCSTAYPHLYPGQKAADKLVILEDTDGDGKADKSSVFADDLHIPLSFEFGNGGVFVSEQPGFTFLKDTDGDGKADIHETLLAGFGTEDSHHSLHDFHWTPDGDLIIRESIFLHSQIETSYGPIRVQNSSWFRYTPRTQRLIAFGSYANTNPWGVTFDDWGQHMASHPIFASAFHALNPTYPAQHIAAKGLQAYSGTCGQEFIDFPNWPADMQGGFAKARYKPTNRIEYLRWQETEFGYEEAYVKNLLFSKDLCFIPVDLRFGPEGGLYVCDWYNPVKGHAQYALRDPRRDRNSGRIWRIMPKDAKPQVRPQIAGTPLPQLLDILKRPEYRVRYWAKRELRERQAAEVAAALDTWLTKLDPADPRLRHHQLEALWLFRAINIPRPQLLESLLTCDEHHARAAATRQLRYPGNALNDPIAALRRSANDENGLVRLEAAIAASYIGTPEALAAMLDTTKHPGAAHLSYAIRTALDSEPLKKLWAGSTDFSREHPDLARAAASYAYVPGAAPETKTTATIDEKKFDRQKDLHKVTVAAVPERIMFDTTEIRVKAGQPIRLTLKNPDATAHNWVLVQPGAEEEVGMAANLMAADPKGAEKNFIPPSKKIIAHTGLVNPEKEEILRFTAPASPGRYPFICTFPGHWVIMRGVLIVE